VITGRSAFLALLQDEGITHLFGNPGTTELPIMAALPEYPDLQYVLGLQEAIVVAMADGYSRASGKLSSCNVHVAPGLGNAMGSLYNAKWIGSPMIITAGQQEQGHGLTEPLLYDPLVPMAEPLCKWSIEVTRLVDLPMIVRRAAKVAMTPPTGPVFISLPGDILNDSIETANIDMGASTRVDAAVRPTDATLHTLAKRLLEANSPVIVAGHECATSNALEQAGDFATALGAPVYQQTVNYGAHFLSEHPSFAGSLNRNQKQVREILGQHDLLILLGSDQLRMSVFSETEPLPAGMPVIQLGMRDWELAKNFACDMAIKSDVRETLNVLTPLLLETQNSAQAEAAAQRLAKVSADNWSVRRDRFAADVESRDPGELMDPDFLMKRIVDACTPETVVVDEGLTSTQSLLKMLPFSDPSGYFGLASGGIGFAMAGAVGIQLAQPDRPTVAVIGDGSAMYSIQSLWTAANMKLPMTYVICNNASYHIIKQRLKAFHGVEDYIGMDFNDPPIDFAGMARSMGVTSHRIERADDLAPALAEATQSGQPRLLDVRVRDSFS